MATERNLTARLEAVDSISDTLGNIAEKSSEAAAGMSTFGESSDEAGDEVEDTRDDVENLSDSFSGLLDNVLLSVEALDLTEEKIESVGDEASQTTAKVSGLAASLETLDSIDDIDIDVDRRIRDVGDVDSERRGVSGRINVEDIKDQIDVEDFPRKIHVEDVDREGGIRGLSRAIRDSSYSADTDSVQRFTRETEINLDDFRSRFDFLEDLGTVDREQEWSSDFLSSDRFHTGEATKRFGSGGPDINVDRDFRRAFADGGVSGLFRGSFAEMADETGDFTENVIDADMASKGLKDTLSDISSASFNLGPMNTSLKTAIVILPALISMFGSLATVLSGFAIGGLAGLGGLAAMMGGGLWFAGEQRGAAVPPEEGGEGGEGGGQVMRGLQDIMSDYSEQAKQALSPLKNQEFANLSLDVLSGGITLLDDFAESVNRLSPLLMEFADIVGGSFWDNEPAFFAQMEMLIAAMLPYLADLTTYLLRTIPDALAFMREEANQLIPILGSFITSLIPLLATMFEVGTAIWSVLLPPLTALIDIINAVASPIATVLLPVVEALGTAMNILWQAVWPILKPFVKIVGIAATVAFALGSISTIAGILSGALTLLSGIITGTVIPALYSLLLSNPLGWVALAIGLIVGLLDHFGLLDDAINGIINAANGLYNILSDLVGEYVIDIFYSIVPKSESPEPGTSEYQAAVQGEKEAGFLDELVSNIKFRFGLGDEKYNLLSDTQTQKQMLNGSEGPSGDLASPGSQLEDSSASSIGSQQGYGETNFNNDVTVNAGSGSSGPRLKRIVSQGVNQAQEDNRQRTSSGN